MMTHACVCGVGVGEITMDELVRETKLMGVKMTKHTDAGCILNVQGGTNLRCC